MRGRLLVVAGLGFGVWCGWVSAYHRSTVPAEITWVVSLVAVVGADLFLARRARTRPPTAYLRPAEEPWPRPGRGGLRRSLAGIAPWLILVVVVSAWEVLGLDTGPDRPHLTLSALAQAYRPLHAALILVWMSVGLGYEVARIRGPRTPTRSDHDSAESGTALGAGGATLGGHPVIPALWLPSSRPVGVVFWIAVPMAGVLVDRMARRSGGRTATAEELVRFVSTPPLANAALMAAWMFAGYHLFAR